MLILAILLQSSTCTTYGNQTTCVDNPLMRPQPPVVMPAPAQVDNQAIGNLGYALRARKVRNRSKKVGKLIAQGNCSEAVTYALERGDLALADYARSYCRNNPR